MRLTVASEYGCLALLRIAESGEAWCKRSDISDRFSIPVAFLEQILRKLTAAGFITSRRGAAGGFRLAREPREITIAEIVRAMEGPLAPVRSVSLNFYEPTPLEASAAFHSLFREVRDAVATILENRTLEDIVRDEQEARDRSTTRNRRGARPPVRRAGNAARR